MQFKAFLLISLNLYVGLAEILIDPSPTQNFLQICSKKGLKGLYSSFSEKKGELQFIGNGPISETAYIHNGRNRRKRYVLQSSRWKKNPVTYNISLYPSPSILEKDVVDKEIEAAFHMWEDVSNLTFKRVLVGKVNIDIRFEVGNHDDDEPFDGKGGTTAHAFYPNFGGSIHFDGDEMWTVKSKNGINLFQVATHEIGHALGLEHTNSPEKTVMSPYYSNYDPDFKLHQDDIDGIQTLYGKKTYSICDSSNIDAGVTMIDGATYIFRGNLVYKMTSFAGEMDPGYPKEISSVFHIHGPIDAAITRSNGISYLFKEDEFWRFTNMTLDLEFPKKISEYFSRIPTPLDAAVVLPRDENIYFFKDRFYWKFDHTKDPPVSWDYPKSITEWAGMPNSFEAAIRVDDGGQSSVYFFKDNLYWKFNDKSESVYLSNPPYPRKTRGLFPGCNFNQF